MGKFQEIDEQRDYVYSSFYDDIGDPIIRVIALMQRKHLKQHLLCLLWYNNTISEKVVSRVYVIPESHYGYRYRSALILCPLKAEQKPEYITITRDVTFTLTNKLKVVYPGVRIYNITKCYPALHPNFGDKQQILENIETSSAIEDKHFVFYIQTVNIDVETLLGKYEEIGVVNVYKWQLPVDSHDIHYYGQLACIHDCLYRYLNSSRWILFADLDEIVVPILTKIFPNPVSDVIFRQGNISTNCRSFMFLNAFIPTFFPDTNLVFPWKAVAKSIGLKYILKTKRGAILGSGQRSKVLVNPRGVEIMSIHVVSVFRYNYTGCVIPPTKALLHHYRSSDPNDLTLRGPFKEILDLQLFADLIISKYLKAKKKY
ncbi:beta-1,4-galactosyltransferase galt-1-like [Patella vulgata]|uniref:beta-1,4-galactosyltransferase galt-1-like n=1 Tax=Patella vulgata TaxID=6465 RepID=UPI002180447F|nr:beta-1,4-galactosyltransferase galt-1-like [Patella vulgata]